MAPARATCCVGGARSASYSTRAQPVLASAYSAIPCWHQPMRQPRDVQVASNIGDDMMDFIQGAHVHAIDLRGSAVNTQRISHDRYRAVNQKAALSLRHIDLMSSSHDDTSLPSHNAQDACAPRICRPHGLASSNCCLYECNNDLDHYIMLVH
jgi:hypothetical protein